MTVVQQGVCRPRSPPCLSNAQILRHDSPESQEVRAAVVHRRRAPRTRLAEAVGMQIHRILLATDLGESAAEALTAAAQLAGRFRASVTAVHILALPPGAVAGAFDIVGEIEQNAKAHLADVARQLTDAGAPVVNTRLRYGDPAEEISGLAREDRYDLIVMGSKALRGFKRALVGSVSEAVVRCAPCPVFVIRPLERAPHRTAAV
jgi:nucleotide-binding universal stress UspA family protein